MHMSSFGHGMNAYHICYTRCGTCYDVYLNLEYPLILS
ncbi:uncharacterized protein PRCAT00006103001 [Priceomyces carsonii]|nr:unnamed protein product [Priceomyces carsonii]